MPRQDYTREARETLGRKARQRCSRFAQADWDPKARTFNPIDILRQSEKGRVAKLLPEKHRRMLAMRHVVSWNQLHDWACGFLRQAIIA